MILPLLAIGIPWFAAYQLVAIALAPRHLAGYVATAGLSLAVSAGLTSMTFFLWLSCRGQADAFYPVLELVFFALTGALLFRSRLRQPPPDSPPEAKVAGPAGSRLQPVITLAFLICLGFGAASLLLYVRAKPHGDWDAYAIWNLGARMLYRGGRHWTNIFLATSHVSEYPLFLQGSIARLWTYLGYETTWVPRALGLMAPLTVVAVITAALWKLRGRSQGLLAGMALLATYHFIEHGPDQYADVPLSLFFLGTAVLFTWPAENRNAAPAFAAGIMAGLAAWTKNEGLIFIACFAVSAAGVRFWQDRRILWRDARGFAAGLLPCLAVIFFHKYYYDTQSMYTKPEVLASAWGKLTDPLRYALVAKAFAVNLPRLGYGPPVLVALYALFVGTEREKLFSSPVLISGGACILMLAAYFFVYILTPQNLDFQLRTSLLRLLLQLWPLALFAVFLALRTPEEAAVLV